MENAKKFFEEVAKTEEAKALFAAIEAPKDDEELVAAYVEIAKKLGVELTAEEAKAYLNDAANFESSEIDDEELSQLVGGDNGTGFSDETLYKLMEIKWRQVCGISSVKSHYLAQKNG